ncbi:MAG: hypothetical protein ACE5F1_01380 [Planctomycetota bacterium]
MLLLAGACATVLRGPEQEVTITTMPENARIRILENRSGKELQAIEASGGRTVFSLPRGADYRVEVTAAGFEPWTYLIRRETSVPFWIADSLTLGLGNLVDAGSGALFELSPAHTRVVLKPSKR